MEGIPRIGDALSMPSPSGTQPAQKPDFKELMGRYLEEVNRLQQDADRAVTDLATGKLDSLHQVVVAMSEADLSFRLMMEVRNKLIEAYREVMRMQV